MTPETNPTPPILAYDSYEPAKDRRLRWMTPAYWGGLLVAGVVYGFIGVAVPREIVLVGPWTDAFLASLGLWVCILLPAGIALNLCIWLRKIIVKEVRYARPRYAFLAGLIAGAFPLSIISSLVREGPWGFLTGVAWNLVVPITASFFVCYRSHLRD